MTSLSAGTKASVNSRVRETVPRMPNGSQSPTISMPSASAGTDSSRMNGSPGTWQVTL